MELKNNPFYILNVDCEADRAEINAAADELAFFDEDGSVEQAQLTLLNPAKRLSAEIDWFPGLNKTDLDQIRAAIEKNSPISFSGRTPSASNVKASNGLEGCAGKGKDVEARLPTKGADTAAPVASSPTKEREVDSIFKTSVWTSS